MHWATNCDPTNREYLIQSDDLVIQDENEQSAEPLYPLASLPAELVPPICICYCKDTPGANESERLSGSILVICEGLKSRTQTLFKLAYHRRRLPILCTLPIGSSG